MFPFSKPDGWKALSPENKTIVKKLSKSKVSDAFVEAIDTGNNALALFLFREAQKNIKPDHLFLCLQKICQKKAGNAELLEGILDALPVAYLNSFPIESQRLMFAEMAKNDFVEGWIVLEQWHLKRVLHSPWFERHHFIKQESRIEIAASYDARTIVNHALTKNDNLLQNALTGALAQEQDNTSLKWLIAKYSPTPQLLTKVLCEEAIRHSTDKATLDKIDILISHGAKVTNDGLLTAFCYRDKIIFNHLLPHWTYSAEGENLMILETKDMQELSILEKVLAEKKGQASPENERFTAPTKDILIETLPLPEGGKLTKVFNFTERRQYTSMTTQGLPPSTPAMTDFEDISNHDIVKCAAEILLHKGGDKDIIEKALAYQRPLRISKD